MSPPRPSPTLVVGKNWLVLVLLSQFMAPFVSGFAASSNSNSNNPPPAPYTLFDRFRPECPANPQSIRRYDPALLASEGDRDGSVWVAVFRSSNNKPTVFVRDEFFNAMRLATGGDASSSASKAAPHEQLEISSKNSDSSTTSGKGFAAADPKSKESSSDNMVAAPKGGTAASQTPVAVARLVPSSGDDFPGTWTLDNMRCSLKKESTDDACEGGSEHKEALSVAIDALLLHYLSKTVTTSSSQKKSNNSQQPEYFFDGALRTKATLVGASLLEERGFQPVQELSKDMATHISSLDGSIEKYAAKYVETVAAKYQGARDRAEQILGLLGRLDREADLAASKQRQQSSSSSSVDGNSDDDGDAGYDPWASFKQIN